MSFYFSVDCEYTGPCPNPYQLLSLGCVAYNEKGEEVGEWYKAFHWSPLVWDAPTLKFWHHQGTAFDLLLDEVDNSQIYLESGIQQFASWIERTNQVNERPVLVADPIAADWPWLIDAFNKAQIPNPFGYKGLCLGSMIRQATRKGLYERVRDPYVSANEHHALEDARAQGRMFFLLKNSTDEEIKAMFSE